MATKIYGIRHHGAGCSKSLLSAFKENVPDIILIEGPPSGTDLIHHVINKKGLKPPVALLVYNPKELKESSFYPFTEFSPEYVAMEFATENNIPVQFIDLPPLVQHKLEEEIVLNGSDERTDDVEDNEAERDIDVTKDPLSYIAKLDGYEDGERWWDVMVENRDSDSSIFKAIENLMIALREELPEFTSQIDLVREAYMRKQIKVAEKSNENVAVVCGAWHLPAFINRPKLKDDNALLKGLPRITAEAAWIPWSYSKIAKQSGYGAGVISPAWYELLYRDNANKIEKWFVKAAQLLRKKDMDASSAHVIEAVRLAKTLAVVRNLSKPGLNELYETCVCIFGNGHEEEVRLISQELIIGSKFGKVDAEISEIPLQKDFRKKCKSYSLKQTEETVSVDLDLRKELHVAKSHFLNRLNILDINWGKKYEGRSGKKKGSFHEEWRLKWRPSFEIKLIENSIWGNTIDTASTNFIQNIADKSIDILEISSMILKCLEADLETPLHKLINRLLDVSAVSTDIEKLMEVLPELVNIYQYGNVRKTDTSQVKTVINGIVPRVCVGLSNACYGLKEEPARDMADKIHAFHRSLNLFENTDLKQEWLSALNATSGANGSNALIQGLCLRLLLDEDAVDINVAEDEMRFQLSVGSDSITGAVWLEGFLQGNALLIVHNQQLWNILNDWVKSLDEERFKELLPMLRRSFSRYSATDRRQIARLVKSGFKKKSVVNGEIDKERAESVVPVIQILLGVV